MNGNLPSSAERTRRGTGVCSLALGIALAGAGCAGDGPPVGATTTTSSTLAATVDLADIQTNIFTPTCAVLGCHDSISRADGLDLSDAATSRTAMVGVTSNCAGQVLVVAGDPDASYLIEKIGGGAGAPCGTVMPLVFPALTADEIQQIRAWIADGAPPAGGGTFRYETTTTSTTTSTTSSTTTSTVLGFPPRTTTTLDTEGAQS